MADRKDLCVEDLIEGKVKRIESNTYYVAPVIDPSRTIRTTLRGKFKKDFRLKKDKLYTTDICVVGDHVNMQFNEDGTGVIQTIHPRKNQLSRKAPRIKGASYRGERLEQVIAANLDMLYVVMSFTQPEFNNKILDRFLVAGESAGIGTAIVMNKIDLCSEDDADWIDFYRDLGYAVYCTCAKSGAGIPELKDSFQGKTSLFWGASGVGKSSLLNNLFPGLLLSTNEISEWSNKGKHTTVSVQMFEVNDESFIIDTPGVREIDPYGLREEDLCHYFVEFVPYINQCKFSGCTHNHEPGCAVVQAVEDGLISEVRYDSYLRILNTTEDDLNF